MTELSRYTWPLRGAAEKRRKKPAVFLAVQNNWKAGSASDFMGVILTLVTLGLLSTGCFPLTSEQSGEDTLPSGSTLFSDDFSNPPSGWGIWSRDGASVDYHNGGLRILVNEAQYDFWSVAGQRFTDAVIEVEATKIAGPDDNDFGVVCRYQDKDNFYMLVASNDGYYGIARVKNGEYSMIGADQLQYSSAIAQGQATNSLRAACVGSTFSLSINDVKLMEATDSSFTSGDVGVLAGAYDTQGVDILFDNFIVKKP